MSLDRIIFRDQSSLWLSPSEWAGSERRGTHVTEVWVETKSPQMTMSSSDRLSFSGDSCFPGPKAIDSAEPKFPSSPREKEHGQRWFEKGQWSRCRRPPYPVPSNRSPPSAAPTDTAPRHTRRKAPAPRMSTSPPKKTSRRAAHRASGGLVRRATGRLLPQPQDVPSGLTTNTEI
ncbi:unnamed protein product, partial [Pleuronectes platessa]